MESVVEAVEIVEETDGAEEFDDFALGVERAEFGELRVGDSMGVAGDGLGKAESGLFGGGKVVALGPVGQVVELIVRPSKSLGEEGVAGQAVGGYVDLAGADDDELF